MLISVIIPTKNRKIQLLKTLRSHRTLLNLPDVEFIVADNSNIETEYVSVKNELAAIYGQNIKYYHCAVEKNIVENFDFGVKKANGEYVICIGDDDFILPRIVDAAKYGSNNNIDCIIYNPDRYYWENCIFAKKSVVKFPGAYIKSKQSDSKWVCPQSELMKAAKNGYLTINDLPRLYHGLVKKTAIQAIINQFGQLIGGSPDISFSTILTLNKCSTFKWNCALSVYGASDGSGGGMTTSKSHKMNLESASFLSNDFRREWDNAIPKYWSEYTVFPASVLYIFKKYGIQSTRYNLASIYVSCCFHEPERFGYLATSFRNLTGVQVFQFILELPLVVIRKTLGAFYREIQSKGFFKKIEFEVVKEIPENKLCVTVLQDEI